MTTDKWVVNPDTGCWEWALTLNRDGYGSIRWSRDEGMFLAHRAMYILCFGEIPEGMVVRHSCDNPCCVNPEHLLLGTQRDNVADCVQRGRRAPQGGDLNHSKKLSSAIVQEIRRRYAGGGVSQQTLGHEYGVSQSCISLIVRRTTWGS